MAESRAATQLWCLIRGPCYWCHCVSLSLEGKKRGERNVLESEIPVTACLMAPDGESMCVLSGRHRWKSVRFHCATSVPGK